MNILNIIYTNIMSVSPTINYIKILNNIIIILCFIIQLPLGKHFGDNIFL